VSEIRTLLYRDWLELKRKYLSYILLWFSLPMVIHLFMVIPLASQIFSVDLMNYTNWASVGIWICSSAIISFTYSNIKIKNLLYKNDYIAKYLKAPISNGQLLVSLLLFSIIIGLIQLAIAMVITIALNNDNLNLMQLLLIFINTASIVTFFSIIGLFFGIHAKDELYSIFIFLIMFIILSFSLGTLIPIEESHNKFLILIRNFPVYKTVLNVQLLYAGKSAIISPVVVMNIINIISFVIVLVFSYKKFRK